MRPHAPDTLKSRLTDIRPHQRCGQGHGIRLNGPTNERYGLTKSLSVMPGDVIKMEVFAKYLDGNTAILTNLFSQITAGTMPFVQDLYIFSDVAPAGWFVRYCLVDSSVMVRFYRRIIVSTTNE